MAALLSICCRRALEVELLVGIDGYSEHCEDVLRSLLGCPGGLHNMTYASMSKRGGTVPVSYIVGLGKRLSTRDKRSLASVVDGVHSSESTPLTSY